MNDLITKEPEKLMDLNPWLDICFKYLLSDEAIRLAIVNDIFKSK